MPTRYTGKFQKIGCCNPIGEAEVTVLKAPPPKPCSICGLDDQSNMEFINHYKPIGYGCRQCVYQMFVEAKAEKEAQEEASRA